MKGLIMYGKGQKCYNINVSTTSKDAQSLFISVRKGGLVRKVALCSWKWKQPSRPF